MKSLRELFEQHGTVHSVRLVDDPHTGRPRGFGFVDMDDGDAQVVLEESYLSAAGGAHGRTYDVFPNGERFLMIKKGGGSEDTTTLPSIVVVQNWFEELKRLVPTN